LNLNGNDLSSLEHEKLISLSTIKAYCLVLPSYQDLKGGPESTKASKSSLKIFQLPFIFDPKKSKINSFVFNGII